MVPPETGAALSTAFSWDVPGPGAGARPPFAHHLGAFQPKAALGRNISLQRRALSHYLHGLFDEL